LGRRAFLIRRKGGKEKGGKKMKRVKGRKQIDSISFSPFLLFSLPPYFTS
jgi:hypothetical protein